MLNLSKSGTINFCRISENSSIGLHKFHCISLSLSNIITHSSKYIFLLHLLNKYDIYHLSINVFNQQFCFLFFFFHFVHFQLPRNLKGHVMYLSSLCLCRSKGHTFKIFWSSPKPPVQLKPNYVGMFIEWSSTKFRLLCFDQQSKVATTTETGRPKVQERVQNGPMLKTLFFISSMIEYNMTMSKIMFSKITLELCMNNKLGNTVSILIVLTSSKNWNILVLKLCYIYSSFLA